MLEFEEFLKILKGSKGSDKKGDNHSKNKDETDASGAIF